MTVHPNSRAAYELVDLNARQAEVLDAITDLCADGWRPSDQDIADWLAWTINRVTPRRGEFEAMGRIVRTGDKLGDAKRKVSTWGPVSIQTDLFAGTP